MINLFDFFSMHINAFLGKAINTAMTKPSHAHMYRDQ